MKRLSRLLGGALLGGVCLASPQASGWQQRTADSSSAVEDARRALESGAYADAERVALAAWDHIDSALPDSPALADTLEVLVAARLAFGSAASASALADAKRVLSIRERNPDDSLGVARSLLVVANAHVYRGDFRSAVPLLERALTLRQQSLPPDDESVADGLDRLAFALVRLETKADAARARQLLGQSLSIREARAGQSPIALAGALEALALADRYAGAYASGLATIDRAIAIRNDLNPTHPALVQALLVRGDLLWLLGDVPGAEGSYRSGLTLSETTLHSRNPINVELVRKLGLTAATFGNLADARRLRERAVALAQASLSPCHPESTGVLNDLAISLKTEGAYIEADSLYRRVLASREHCLGLHSLTASTAFNLANLLKMMGNLSEAERLQERAVQDWSATVGPDHPFVALALNTLAQTVADRGNRARAAELFNRALELRRRILVKDHPDIAATLIGLASLLDKMGRSRQALRHLDEAASIYNERKVSDQPLLISNLLMVRGNIEARTGNTTAAAESFGKALAARERMYGPTHPLAAETRAELAAIDIRTGAFEGALSNALEAEEIGRTHVRSTIRFLPERQAMNYAAKRPRALDLAISAIAADGTANPAPVLDAVIQSRGIVLEALIGRSAFAGVASRAQESTPDLVARARQRYANLMVKSIAEPVARALLDEALRQKEEVERSATAKDLEGRPEVTRASIGLAEVGEALAEGATIISFVVYDRTARSVASGTRAPWPLRSYGAFLRRSGSTAVTFVRLGPAEHIDGLIRSWRAEAASGVSTPGANESYRAAAVRLRRAIWDPLQSGLADANRIFVVPDGLLSIVNIAALSSDNGRFLVEGRAVIHNLSTERDLVYPSDRTAGRGLLAAGGASFGGRPALESTTAMARRSGCGESGTMHFTDLPGSRSEVDAISRFWPAASDESARILTGAAATETAIKQNLSGRRIVHFATHGFFLAGDCQPGASGRRAVGGLVKKAPARPAAGVTHGPPDNPLLLAGLAFAGANRRRTGTADEDDGILTAEEIGSLNLQGVEWAVLSACDTGLGEIRAGEGVFGLRRAFQVAGARTVIMSLWSVEDRSAMDWMRALYEGRLRKGLDTANAVREASLSVLRQRRARGQSVHPFYWAGFVASGDWR